MHYSSILVSHFSKPLLDNQTSNTVLLDFIIFCPLKWTVALFFGVSDMDRDLVMPLRVSSSSDQRERTTGIWKCEKRQKIEQLSWTENKWERERDMRESLKGELSAPGLLWSELRWTEMSWIEFEPSSVKLTWGRGHFVSKAWREEK